MATSHKTLALIIGGKAGSRHCRDEVDLCRIGCLKWQVEYGIQDRNLYSMKLVGPEYLIQKPQLENRLQELQNKFDK